VVGRARDRVTGSHTHRIGRWATVRRDEETALREGQPAPDFTKTTADGETVSLSGLRGSWVVLYFYPADDTPGCTAEACSFRDSYEDFTDAGAVVIGVSRDSAASHTKFSAKYNLPFSLLSDEDGAMRKAYEVKKSLGLIPGRVTYVIDPEGIVRKVFSSQTKAKQHKDEALEAIRAGSPA
jgi:peroxiredoxin Q/BCP